MADNKEQFDKETPPEFSDEAIRRFLFASLSAEEQLAFEERLFADDRFEARVRRAECELADDYAFERLSPAERELFEHRFLVSTGRQQKLRLSNALREHFAANVTQTVSLRAQPVQTAPSKGITIGERLQRLLGLNQPAWRLALRVAILIALMVTIWSVLQSPSIRKRFITKRRPAPAASPVTNQQESHHPTKASPPLQEETPTPPESKGPPSAADQVSVALVPGNIYDPDRIPRVSLPDGEGASVGVQLAFKTNQLETYRAELLTVAGQSVFSEGSLKSASGNAPIEFEIPVRVLKAGDYQVKLSRINQGNEESVATYYFRVQ